MMRFYSPNAFIDGRSIAPYAGIYLHQESIPLERGATTFRLAQALQKPGH